MTRDSPTDLPSTSELLARYDQQHVDTAVVYDITAQATTSLQAAIIACRSSATTSQERELWTARLHEVDQDRTNLDPDDRAALVAQQLTWVNEASALLESTSPPD